MDPDSVKSTLSNLAFGNVMAAAARDYQKADWKALGGALVGCLALIRRTYQVGRVSLDDAKAVLESFLQSLHVQSLGQHDWRSLLPNFSQIQTVLLHVLLRTYLRFWVVIFQSILLIKKPRILMYQGITSPIH